MSIGNDPGGAETIRMQKSVELSLYSLRQGVLDIINMHKSVNQMFIVKTLVVW